MTAEALIKSAIEINIRNKVRQQEMHGLWARISPRRKESKQNCTWYYWASLNNIWFQWFISMFSKARIIVKMQRNRYFANQNNVTEIFFCQVLLALWDNLFSLDLCMVVQCAIFLPSILGWLIQHLHAPCSKHRLGIKIWDKFQK